MVLKKCVKCGSRSLVKDALEDTILVGGRTFVAALQARRCEACGEVYVDGRALEAFEKAVDLKLAQDGPATGETFRRLRKALGLRAAEVAELLDIRTETVSRWETGATNVDRAAWAMLATMMIERAANSTATIDRLRALREPPKLAKVTLKVRPSARRVS